MPLSTPLLPPTSGCFRQILQLLSATRGLSQLMSPPHVLTDVGVSVTH
jgi:hypothetical protein